MFYKRCDGEEKKKQARVVFFLHLSVYLINIALPRGILYVLHFVCHAICVFYICFSGLLSSSSSLSSKTMFQFLFFLITVFSLSLSVCVDDFDIVVMNIWN